MIFKTPLTREQALQKLRHFCAYQERCHSEVKDKLFKLGVRVKEHDEIIAALIEDNYLNEERFAIAYAGGKWRVKRWGRVKLTYELRQKKVSEYCIKKALKQISGEEYGAVLQQLLEEKYADLKEEQYLTRKKKTMDYAVGRGFEPNLVRAAIENL